MPDYDNFDELPPYDDDSLPPPDATEAFVGNTLNAAAELLERGRNTLSFARGLKLLDTGKIRDIYLTGYNKPWGETLQQIVDGKAKREAVFGLARSLKSDYTWGS